MRAFFEMLKCSFFGTICQTREWPVVVSLGTQQSTALLLAEDSDDDRLQLQSLLGQQVFRLLAGGSRLPVLHEAGRNETLQALGKDVRGESQALLKLREACEVAEHRVVQDQQAPTFADQLERPGGGALLIPVEASKHMDKDRPFTCITQPCIVLV